MVLYIRSCPLDMKEPVSGIVYAAPLLENSPELAKLRALFLIKYGNDFPQETVQDGCVDTRVSKHVCPHEYSIRLLSCF